MSDWQQRIKSAQEESDKEIRDHQEAERIKKSAADDLQKTLSNFAEAEILPLAKAVIESSPKGLYQFWVERRGNVVTLQGLYDQRMIVSSGIVVQSIEPELRILGRNPETIRWDKGGVRELHLFDEDHFGINQESPSDLYQAEQYFVNAVLLTIKRATEGIKKGQLPAAK